MIHLSLGLPLDVVRDIGWTLIHFLWQGLVLAALLQVILPMCRGAVIRHNWALGTLVTMALAPVMTYVLIHGSENKVVLQGAVPGAVSGSVSRVMAAATDMLVPAATCSPWIDWTVAIWFMGIAALSLRILGGWYLADTLRRRDTIALSPDLLQRCRDLQRRLAVTWPVQFLQSRRVSVPVVVGWFKPVVLIPFSVITGLLPEQLDALIMHELAHIRRLDAFTNVIMLAVETILFYHPAVWWVSRRVRIEREHCCDDFAVSGCGDPAMYVEALASLETWKAAPAFALAANGSRLKERVARLLGVSSSSRKFSLSAVIGLLSSFLVIAAATATQNHDAAAMPVYYDLPEMAVNTSTLSGLKIVAVLEVNCADYSDSGRKCTPEVNAIHNAVPAIIDNFQDEFRGLKPDDVIGKGSAARLRDALLPRINAVTRPSGIVKDVLFKDLVIGSSEHMQMGPGTFGMSVPNLFDLPAMTVNTSTLGLLKFKTVLELNCPKLDECVRAIEDVLPSILDGVQDELRGLKLEDLMSKDGMARVRGAMLGRINAVTRPPGVVKDVRFTEVAVTAIP